MKAHEDGAMPMKKGIHELSVTAEAMPLDRMKTGAARQSLRGVPACGWMNGNLSMMYGKLDVANAAQHRIATPINGMQQWGRRMDVHRHVPERMENYVQQEMERRMDTITDDLKHDAEEYRWARPMGWKNLVSSQIENTNSQLNKMLSDGHRSDEHN